MVNLYNRPRLYTLTHTMGKNSRSQSSSTSSKSKRPPTRRRGAVLEEAILSAAVDELVAEGYGGMSMDRIAMRAGTNKNAIYRRWANRAAIGMAAYRRLATANSQPPDTGDLRKDVLTLLRRANRQFSTPNARILLDVLSIAGSDPELQKQLHQLAADAGSAEWLEVLGHAVDRGELRAGALDPRVATVAIVLLRNEYVVGRRLRVSDRILIEITDKVYLPLVRSY